MFSNKAEEEKVKANCTLRMVEGKAHYYFKIKKLMWSPNEDIILCSCARNGSSRDAHVSNI